MRQALEIGWLCKYRYYPHIVYLDEDELEEYVKISKQLLMHLNPATKTYNTNPFVEMLFWQGRESFIRLEIKKVYLKVSLLRVQAKKEFKIYFSLCSRGLDPDYSAVDDYIRNADDNSLINEYTRLVNETDDSVMVKQYHFKI
jgi:hypothetical protein